jgi:hypothetical protein
MWCVSTQDMGSAARCMKPPRCSTMPAKTPTDRPCCAQGWAPGHRSQMVPGGPGRHKPSQTNGQSFSKDGSLTAHFEHTGGNHQQWT